MKTNRFYYRLKKYLEINYPMLCNEEVLIGNRADTAMEIYSESITKGLSQEESNEEAEKVLYKDFKFSPFQLIIDIVKEIDATISDSSNLELSKKLLKELMPIINKYNISDDFERSSMYDTLYDELKLSIELHFKK